MNTMALPCDILKLTPTTEGRWRERWEVRGDSGTAYIVSRDVDGEYGCSCPQWKFRRQERCKHIQRLAYYVGSERMSTTTNEPAAKPETEAARRLRLEVSPKGGISVYGLQRFPVTLYMEQWIEVLGYGQEIVAFIEANAGRLKHKGGD